MNRIFQTFAACMLATALLAHPPTHAQSTAPKTLILYDAPSGSPYQKLGFAYAIMLRNLLGHFSAAVTMKPVQNYTAGQVENYNATFYLGSYYDNPVPAAFLHDVMSTTKTVVWFKDNIWQLAWNADYGFTQRYGITFSGLRGLNATPTAAQPAPGFFDDVLYKNKEFIKYYAYDTNTGAVNADPDIGVVGASDPAKAVVVASIRNRKTGETAPYAVRAGNFWYFADVPFSYIGPRDRYLVAADLLHDVLGSTHAENHLAMVRLEDVDALVSRANMKTLTDYLYTNRIPFSIAAIPLYKDPLGKYNNGVAQTIPLSQAGNMKTALNYALTRGGEIVQHGYTHQYSNVPNRFTAVSADDFEFWDAVHDRPLPEDSFNWGYGRIAQGRSDLINNGYTPIAWETPHYQGSANANRAGASLYRKTYQRVVYYTADTPNFGAATGRDYEVGQFFPYPIDRDYYGQHILPENLGNIEYDISYIDPTSNITYTWQDLYTNAQFGLAVRDGYASFFFHPFWLDASLNLTGFSDFKKIVTGIKGLGYQWTSPSRLP